VKVGVGIGVGCSAFWNLSAILDSLIEIAETVFEFILDSLTRGNLDNDELGL